MGRFFRIPLPGQITNGASGPSLNPFSKRGDTAAPVFLLRQKWQIHRTGKTDRKPLHRRPSPQHNIAPIKKARHKSRAVTLSESLLQEEKSPLETKQPLHQLVNIGKRLLWITGKRGIPQTCPQMISPFLCRIQRGTSYREQILFAFRIIRHIPL